MTSKIGWYVEGRVLYLHAAEVVSMNIVRHMNSEGLDFLDTSTSRVHLIVDARDVRQMPHNLVELRKASRMLDHLLIGWIVVITTDTTITFLASVIPQMLTRTHSRVVPTFDDAVAFLRDTDPTVNWDMVDETVLAQ